MALLSYKGFVFSALLLMLGSNIVVLADDDSDEAVVETEDETYTSPNIDSKNIYFKENFDDEAAFKKRWIKSEAKKQGVSEDIAKYDGEWQVTSPTRKIFKDDLGLVLTTEAKHAAISALLDKPFVFKDKPFVVQYEVTMQEGQDCGGAYIKLLSQGTNTKDDLRKFHDQTGYTIMFGPDKCGTDSKLHFIFRHRNPVSGVYEEKHSKKPSERIDEIFKDKEPHLYTLIIRPDNTFSVLVDKKLVNSGSLLEDFNPAVNPPEEIDDPNDSKPKDWDEREKIVDPAAVKPEDWDEEAPAKIPDVNAVKPDGWLEDEPEVIHDPEATKPSDWDDDMDGEWEPPLIDNPKCKTAPGCGPWTRPIIANPNYKGKWYPPHIPNPNYQGKWRPRMIPNPNYFRDETPFKMTTINALGFELWSMSPRLLFDNLLITDDESVLEQWTQITFNHKRDKLNEISASLWGRMVRAMGYNPGYWAMYIVYCLIPITAYVTYLISRLYDKESVVDRSINFVKENPWMYGVFVVVLLVFVLFIMYLRSSSEDPKDPSGKKTDAINPDDEPGVEEEEEEPRSGKAGLEKPDETEKQETKEASIEDDLSEKDILHENTDEGVRQRKKVESEGSGDANEEE